MTRGGVPLGAINTVFLTHHHFDHIGDLYDVMLNSWMHGRKDDLRIYGPPDTERLVNTLITQVYDKDIAWRDQGEPTFGGWKPVVATDIIPGPVLDTGRWKISAELVSHGDGLDMSSAFLARWMCLGFRFEAEGKVIAISGDTVPCPVSSGWLKEPTYWCSAAFSRRLKSTTTISAGSRNTRSPAAIRSARLPPRPASRSSR
ncbi:MBL fold metallo-hydrolase [Bradyrhizobium barranii]